MLPSIRRASLVAVTELRRTSRKAFSWSARSLVLVALLPLALLAYAAGLGALAYFVGPDLASGGIPLRHPRAAAAGVVAMVAFFTGQRTVKRTGRIDGETAILTAIPARDALVGLMAAEYVRSLTFVLVPTVVTGAGLAAGTGVPAVAVSLAAVVLSLVLLGLALGYVLGLGVKNVAARSSLVANNRTVVGLVTTAVLFGGYVLLTADPTASGTLVRTAAGLPTGWLVDLALLPIGRGDPLLGLAGAGVVLAAIPVLGWLAVLEADWLWFVDPAQPDERVRESAGAGRVERLLAGSFGRTTARVALKSWRRAARAPFTVQYAVVPFFTLFTPIQQTVQTGQVPAYLPAMLSLSAAWATGAAFTLNPIGGEGAVLPAVLAADVDGREFLGGLALAGVAVGVPLVVVLTAGAGVLSDAPPGLVAGWLLVGVALSLVAPGVAAAAGAAFPKFETTHVGSNREAIIPSLWAFALYTVVFGIAVVPSLAAVHPALLSLAADAAGVAAASVAAAGFALTLALGAAFGGAGAWVAVRRFEGYTLA